MKDRLRELAFLFLKLGTIAFGGPAAHIAMMEEEVVKQRGWMTHEQFLDLLGATNLIPGPNSTEMAIHIGYERGGWKGLIVAGACFIFPAVVITILLAHLYVTYGETPQVGPFIFGIRAAIIAVILAAVVRLGRPFTRSRFLIAVGLAVAVLNILHIDELTLLLGAGVLGIIWENRSRLKGVGSLVLAVGAMTGVPLLRVASSEAAASGNPTLSGLGLFFLKVGSVLYGSGYVLVAFLQGGLVDVRHWLTQTQLLDAIAIGQFTPGPVLSASAFIGYVLLGLPGALVAAVGIFLPSFIFVLIVNPLIPKLRKSPLMRGFLDGVNAAALGLMIAVGVSLGVSTLTGVAPWVIFVLALAAVVIWRVNAMWIVLGSASLSWLFSLLHI
jgi:chromate transporter